VAIISRLEQVTDLRQRVTDLIKTLEMGGIAQMEPHERLDLWQYLQAVRVRLALAEQALGGEAELKDQSGSNPSTTDISLRMRARRARARRRSWASGIEESGGRRASR
jgi:hypothetical protein